MYVLWLFFGGEEPYFHQPLEMWHCESSKELFPDSHAGFSYEPERHLHPLIDISDLPYSLADEWCSSARHRSEGRASDLAVSCIYI